MYDPKLPKKIFKDLLFLIPLSAFFLVFYLWKGALASWDEAIYAAVAKEILKNNDWFNLTLQGALWFDKPPLAIWATAFFYKIFGINEFSARLFSGLCGVGLVTVTYFIGMALFNRWTGFCGALILLSSSHFLHLARFGVLDVPLIFFLSLALYFFWLGRERNLYFIFSGVALGLAIMTKSFAAMLFIPITFLYCLFAGELDILKRKSFWLSLLIAFLIALPWHLYEFFYHHDAFMSSAVSVHLFTRTLTAMEGHVGNYYFYIRTLVNKFHPWILVGVVSAPFFLFQSIRKRESEFVFLTVWMFFYFLVVTVIKTKLGWYIAPVYPALSITIAYLFVKIFKDNHSNAVRLIFLVIMMLHVPYSKIFNHDYAADIKGIAPITLKEVPVGKILYLYDYHESPAGAFYLERQIAYLDTPQILLDKIRASDDFYCLIRKKHLDPIALDVERAGAKLIGDFEELILITKR